MKAGLFLIFVLGASTFQQCRPETHFSERVFLKYYGKAGNQIAADILVNADGTFFILGTVDSQIIHTVSRSRIYLAKADKNGNCISEMSYTLYKENTRQAEETVAAKDMELTADGTLLILAETGHPPDSYQLIKVNPSDSVPLAVMYSKSVNGLVVHPTSVTRIPGGKALPAGYMICGMSDNGTANSPSAAMMSYVDENLIEVSNFTTVYSQGTRDAAVKAFQFDDSYIVVFGYTDSPTHALSDIHNSSNFWVYLIDQYGVPKASRKMNFKVPSSGDAWTDDSDEFAAAAIQTGAASGNGYMVCGFKQTAAPQQVSTYPCFLKLTSALRFQDSDTEFYACLDGKDDNLRTGNIFQNTNDDPYKIASVCSASDGGYYALYTRNTAKGEIVLYKLDMNGKKLWSHVFGGDFEDYAAAVAEGIDGSIIVYGTITVGTTVTSDKKIALFKLNKDGRLE